MSVINNSIAFISISVIAIIASLVSILTFGLNPSIDFSGGTVYEVAYTETIYDFQGLNESIVSTLPGSVVQQNDQRNVVIKTVDFSDERKTEIDAVLLQWGTYTEVRLRQLGPSISTELVNKSLTAIALVILVIIIFIAYTFRTVSQPVSSWKYGLIAILALIHDTIIPVGVFAFLGSVFIQYQIDVLFITAILATLGYSVNDTIVIFDRVREHLNAARSQSQPIAGEHFKSILTKALSQSIRRSLFTSLTTLIVLVSLFLVGGSTTQPFALVLAIGVIAGTYSSLCFACPLLWHLGRSVPQSNESSDTVTDDDSQDNLPDDIKRFLAKQNK